MTDITRLTPLFYLHRNILKAFTPLKNGPKTRSHWKMTDITRLTPLFYLHRNILKAFTPSEKGTKTGFYKNWLTSLIWIHFSPINKIFQKLLADPQFSVENWKWSTLFHIPDYPVLTSTTTHTKDNRSKKKKTEHIPREGSFKKLKIVNIFVYCANTLNKLWTIWCPFSHNFSWTFLQKNTNQTKKGYLYLPRFNFSC